MIYLVIYDITTDKRWVEYFKCEYDRRLRQTKLKYSNKLFVIGNEITTNYEYAKRENEKGRTR